MENKTSYADSNQPINSVLSFKPIFTLWQSIITEGREGTSELYRELFERIKLHAELIEPIQDHSILHKHSKLIEQLMATIFPVTMSDKEDLFAVSIPFTYTTVYSSQLFKNLFLNETGDFIIIPDDETRKKLDAEKKASAYQLILNKFYNVHIDGQVRSVHPYKNPTSGLDRYMELEIDTRFVDVHTDIDLPTMPEECIYGCRRIADILNNPQILDWLSLDQFKFEGIAIIRIREVTEREVINNVKTSLLTLQSFSDVDTFRQLQTQMENLIGVPAVQIGITPFFTLNNRFVFSRLHNDNSILLKNLGSIEEKNKLSDEIKTLFESRRDLLVVPEINAGITERYPFLKHIGGEQWKSIIICPLYNDKKLSGILEVVSEIPGKLDYGIVIKIEPVIPLFELALEKSAENLEAQIDKIIKEQFTAVQSSVEWRFTEAALNYLIKSQQDEDVKIENIAFHNVYPLYGAIDIRNSSTERNKAIQKDLLEQLQMAGAIIKKAKKATPYPLLDEINYKIKKYTHSVSNIILSDEEVAINKFLKEEIVHLFQHLRSISPSIEDEIVRYFAAVDTVVDMIYHHRKNFDESITYINKTVARFIDREQQAAQQIFPHYFERFVTDGVDFNIYIGQSICPQIPFDDFYLKNLKIWQLTTLAKAARLSKQFLGQLPVPLQTTQLILAHSHPISISFRTAERKFDVDGAYNIRYEIIKKRIDKVHIKDSNERLTQPGAIAIVYSQPQEGEEYLEYIEFLQSQNLLKGEVEKYELEELQGVSGLKALRVLINLEEEEAKEIKTEDKKTVSNI